MNWTTINRARIPEERKARRACKKALNKQLAPLRAMVKAANTLEEIARVARYKVDSNIMEDTVTGIYTTVGPKFARMTRSKLKTTKADDPAFAQFRDRMMTYARTTAGARITAISDFTNEEVQRIIGGVIEQAVDNGWGSLEAIDLVLEKFNTMEFARAERIARTEVLTASNQGSLYGASSLGVPYQKKWVATKDNRTRESHSAMNGELTGQDGTFSNGLEYPGDPNGDASEVVNCRCAIGYEL